MDAKEFDLNIERILEDWEIYHAIREVIANAIDEQVLTETKDIQISKDSDSRWHIRDFGRGIRDEHLTQKESDEKLTNPHVIGKFGIGLKDALATFDRKGVEVIARSKHVDITLGKARKHGFDKIVTLHAYISPPSEPALVGTEFILNGVSDSDIEKAKDLFLIFSGERSIEGTKYGEVLEKKGEIARIYINGVNVAEEGNFLFSYNITSLTQKIRRALNRERSNVGRSAYSDRVKSILLSCEGKDIADSLVDDLKQYFLGEMHDELMWLDVQEHAVRILNAAEMVVFFTPEELIGATDMVDEAKTSGYRIVTIPENLKARVSGQSDVNGGTIRDLGQFHTEYIESFDFDFIEPDQLGDHERKVLGMSEKIFRLAGGKPSVIKEVRISQTMRKEIGALVETKGLWDAAKRRIVIKRDQLSDLDQFASTLLHETAHAISGAADVTRGFEMELTALLGAITTRALSLD